MIAVSSALRGITDVLVDGFSQPGSEEATLNSPAVVNIVLEGSGADGVHLYGGSTVRGLAIRNFFYGVHIFGDNNRVEGSYIGINENGVDSEPNEHGVYITEGVGNRIGGTAPAQRNVIAFNDQSGVTVLRGMGNEIVQNSIILNRGPGIDLGGDGVTPNDGVGDLDDGPNLLQNSPRIVSATYDPEGQHSVSWGLKSTASERFRVEFFASPGCINQGRRFVGSEIARTDAFGVEDRRSVLASELNDVIAQGEFLTATATSLDNPTGTSEFSGCVQLL